MGGQEIYRGGKNKNRGGNASYAPRWRRAWAVRGSYKITVSGLWHVNQIGSFGKTKSHVDDSMRLEDDNLNWKQQTKEQCSKVARGSWALNQLKHFVDEQILRSVYHCLIYSHLQYCISSWGTASKPTSAPLFILQKRNIRFLTGSEYLEHTNPLFYRAKCLKLKDIYSLETAKLMYKIHNNVLSVANLYKFNLIKNCYTHKTRLSHKNNFFLPRTRTRLGQKSLSYAGIKIWNEIPSSMKEVFSKKMPPFGSPG